MIIFLFISCKDRALNVKPQDFRSIWVYLHISEDGNFMLDDIAAELYSNDSTYEYSYNFRRFGTKVNNIISEIVLPLSILDCVGFRMELASKHKGIAQPPHDVSAKSCITTENDTCDDKGNLVYSTSDWFNYGRRQRRNSPDYVYEYDRYGRTTMFMLLEGDLIEADARTGKNMVTKKTFSTCYFSFYGVTDRVAEMLLFYDEIEHNPSLDYAFYKKNRTQFFEKSIHLHTPSSIIIKMDDFDDVWYLLSGIKGLPRLRFVVPSPIGNTDSLKFRW